MPTLRIIEAFRNLFYSPLYVTQSLGYFEAQGLEVEIHTRQPGEEVVEVLKAGGADLALTGPMRGLVAADAGETDIPISFIEVNSRDGFMLLTRHPAPPFSWADLHGRTVLTYKEPPTPWMCLLRVLKTEGIDPKAVEISTERPQPDAIEAFKAGAGDFIQLPEPLAQQLIADGQAYFAAAMGQSVGAVPYTAFAATRARLESDKDLLLSFTRAVYAGQRWMAVNGAASITMLAAGYVLDAPPEILQPGIQRYLNQGTWAIDPLLRREGFERLRDILIEGGLIRGPHHYEDHVDTSLATTIMSERLGP